MIDDTYVNNSTYEAETPLYWAVEWVHKDIVEFLLANGAMINALSLDGSPLHNAAKNGNKDMVELLLANGAEVNIENVDGWTPLELAIQSGHKDVEELLLQHGGHEYDLFR